MISWSFHPLAISPWHDKALVAVVLAKLREDGKEEDRLYIELELGMRELRQACRER